MKAFKAFDIAASGMTASQFNMDVISNNIANAHTTEAGPDGKPYRRQVARVTPDHERQFSREFATASFDFGSAFDEEFDFGAGKASFNSHGVRVSGVEESQEDFRWVYDPGNPRAEKSGPHKGYVAMPNVNVIEEMTSMMQASRSFEANAATAEAAKAMCMKALEIGKG